MILAKSSKSKNQVVDEPAHASLAHMVRYWTPKPAIISCTRSSRNFFAVVKSFYANTAICANFVLTVKNSNANATDRNILVCCVKMQRLK